MAVQVYPFFLVQLHQFVQPLFYLCCVFIQGLYSQLVCLALYIQLYMYLLYYYKGSRVVLIRNFCQFLCFYLNHSILLTIEQVHIFITLDVEHYNYIYFIYIDLFKYLKILFYIMARVNHLILKKNYESKYAISLISFQLLY